MSLTQLLPDARRLSAADKLRLIRILAEDVAPDDDIAPLEHGRIYELATPTFEPGAADLLLRELAQAGQP